MFAVKDEIFRDEGPDRADLGGGCPGEEAGPESPVKESKEWGALHGVKNCQLLFSISQHTPVWCLALSVHCGPSVTPSRPSKKLEAASTNRLLVPTVKAALDIPKLAHSGFIKDNIWLIIANI